MLKCRKQCLYRVMLVTVLLSSSTAFNSPVHLRRVMSHPLCRSSGPLPSDGMLGPSSSRTLKKAFASTIRAAGSEGFLPNFAEVLGQAGQPTLIPRKIKEAADDWLTMCAAVAVSGGASSDFATNGGYPPRQDIARSTEAAEESLGVLLDTCALKAPQLLKDEVAVLPLARLAVWVPSALWVRGLDEWEGVDKKANESVALRALTAHLLEKYDTPPVLHGALAYRGDVTAATVPEAAHRVAYAFLSALTAAGSGQPVREALNKALTRSDEQTGVVSKTTWKAFVTAPPASSPLHALRRAQVAAQKAPAWVAEGVIASAMGRALLGAGKHKAPLAPDGLPAGVSELAGLAYIDWVCKHAEELAEPAAVATAIDYALHMRASQDAGYALAGRTPKTIAAATEAYALTSIKFDKDEIFEPNAYGIKGLLLTNVTIPKGTVIQIPYDEPVNGGPGKYFLGEGSDQGRGMRAANVRIAEILSLRELIRQGNKLNNCLEDKYESQVKYVMRARQRTSSFWSFTYTYEGASEATHILLLEIWHLRQGNIVRQAEGPRPRTLPGPEAWYYMVQWCEREKVTWETWDVYSRVSAPIPPPPVL